MRVAVVLLLLTAAVYGKPDGGKIVHGHDGDINDFPYQVSVIYGRSHTCGGSILSNTVVLTAAHCTNGFDARYFSIHVGDTRKFGRNGQRVKVGRVIQHENFDSKVFDNDMSLLILVSPLVFNQGVQPITLALREPPANVYATVTGWGRLSDGGALPDILQVVEVPIMSKDQCETLYPHRLTDNMMCAGFVNGYFDSCQGDSGGPLAYNGQLVGVVSWGIGCAQPKNPGVYASVPKMINWIKLNANL